MVKADSKPVSEKELEEESDIEEIIEKDSQGVPQLLGQDNVPDETNYDEETYVGKPAPKESETYIQERKSYSMMHTDQNKLKNTKIGDHINYYDNGVAGAGVVTKMSGQIIQIFKDDGQYHNLSINDTFHVADILINKTWNAMNMEERTTELIKIKAYSPRFLGKTWEELPRELKDVMKIDFRTEGDYSHVEGTSGYKDPKKPLPTAPKNDPRRLSPAFDESHNIGKSKISKAEWDSMKSSIEDGALGNTGNSPTTGVSTKIPFDAAPDYEGASHAKISPDESFEYEDVKPEAGKEPQAPKVDKDEQGIVKTQEFTYSDKPNNYKVPQDKYKGTSRYGIRYGVKFINKEGDE